jgi:hypothetical protein
MGFFDSLTGKKQAKEIEAGKVASNALLQKGWAGYQPYAQQASARLEPYAQQGQQANTTYSNALGLNGYAAQQGAVDSYQQANPYMEHQNRTITNQLMRQYNAQGLGDSGTSRLATARALADRGAQDWQTYLGHLSGMGQRGGGYAAQQGAYDLDQGHTYYGMQGQMAGNEINAANAKAQARSAGMNSLLSGIGTLAGSAFGLGRGMGK